MCLSLLKHTMKQMIGRWKNIMLSFLTMMPLICFRLFCKEAIVYECMTVNISVITLFDLLIYFGDAIAQF